MATIANEAEYWAQRAERELQLARQCSGTAAHSHKARASRYRDLEHRAMRQSSASEPRGQTIWF
jgi:hypothetical protein